MRATGYSYYTFIAIKRLPTESRVEQFTRAPTTGAANETIMCELLLEVCQKNDYYNKNHIGQFVSGGRRAPTDESCPALFWVGVTRQAGSSNQPAQKAIVAVGLVNMVVGR